MSTAATTVATGRPWIFHCRDTRSVTVWASGFVRAVGDDDDDDNLLTTFPDAARPLWKFYESKARMYKQQARIVQHRWSASERIERVSAPIRGHCTRSTTPVEGHHPSALGYRSSLEPYRFSKLPLPTPSLTNHALPDIIKYLHATSEQSRLQN